MIAPFSDRRSGFQKFEFASILLRRETRARKHTRSCFVHNHKHLPFVTIDEIVSRHDYLVTRT